AAAPIQPSGDPASQVDSESSRVGYDISIVIVGVQLPSVLQLLEIIDAADAFGFLFGFSQDRQKHGCQDGDDGNNHQQFDQSEGANCGPTAKRLHKFTGQRSLSK